MADISDFDDDARSGYDLNEYTQGNFDGMLESGAPTPTKGEKKEGGEGGGGGEDDDDVGTCTDIGDYLDDGMGGSDGENGYNEMTDSQDIRSFMHKRSKNKKSKGKSKGRAKKKESGRETIKHDLSQQNLTPSQTGNCTPQKQRRPMN